LKRLLIGPALRNDAQPAQLLPKWIALPVFSSDLISSVAYATEQILLFAGLGGAAYLWLASPVAVAVVVLLAIVVLSYRQICNAYPNGGGAFSVSQDNLGEKAALTAAAALLVDYVMTVTVSVVAGVLAITSKFPGLQPHAAQLAMAVVGVLAVVNLRGLKQSGTAFALPTYAFIVLVFLLLATASYQALLGGGLTLASGSGEQLPASQPVGGYLAMLLALRAFAAGSAALGVPRGCGLQSRKCTASRQSQVRGQQRVRQNPVALLLLSTGSSTLKSSRRQRHISPRAGRINLPVLLPRR
jgi:amino acid transporter